MPYDSWKKYEFPERWTSYWMQIDEVLKFSPTTCLEIGVGNGIVTDGLKRQNVEITTLDIDPSLQPTIIGSVEKIPLPDASVDVALCAEVLEHLPFDAFEGCIKELMRVSRKGVVLSLPHWGYTIRFVCDLPGLPPLRAAWKLPLTTTIAPRGVHCWEIGRKGYPLQRIMQVLQQYARVEKEWLSPWMPYHHFFRLTQK